MAFAETFKALSDPVRREILVLLKKEKLSAGEIGKHFEMTGATISYHLKILKKADLIRETKYKNFYLLRAEYFCGGRADALAVRLERGFNIMKENKSKVIITSIVTVFQW